MNLDNYEKKILQKLYCRLRSKKQLLILYLYEQAQLSLWNAQEKLWQEDFVLQQEYMDMSLAMEGKQTDASLVIEQDKLEDFLRDALLRHDVEENALLIVVLPDAMLESEQITLPQLTEKQLRKTLGWEAEQLFSVSAKKCSWCYKVLQEAANGEQQVVKLWQLEGSLQEMLVNLAQKLLLKLEGICVVQQEDLPLDSVAGKVDFHVEDTEQPIGAQAETITAQDYAQFIARQWFAGERLLDFPALPKQVDWQLLGRRSAFVLPRVACVAFIIALSCYAAAWGACWLARADLQNVQADLQRYAAWQERRAESANLEKQLAQLRQQAKRATGVSVAKELEAWGKLGAEGMCLTTLECTTNNKTFQMLINAQGLAKDAQALESLVEILQKSGRYAAVTLQESQQQARGVAFTLQLVNKQAGILVAKEKPKKVAENLTSKGAEHEREN